MEIRINTDESGPDEFTALIALFASLGGRLPNLTRAQQALAAPNVRQELEIRSAAELAAEIAPDQAVEQEVPADQQGGPPPSRDSKGTPWDARIHSESKATVADGTWRKRRGVSDELFNEVMAELTADIAPPPPADDQDEDVPLAPASDSDVPAPPAPTADAPSAPEPVASAPVAGSDGQFASFAEFVAAVAKHGKTYVELNEMANTVGVAAFKDLKDHADKWDMFFAMI